MQLIIIVNESLVTYNSNQPSKSFEHIYLSMLIFFSLNMFENVLLDC